MGTVEIRGDEQAWTPQASEAVTSVQLHKGCAKGAHGDVPM